MMRRPLLIAVTYFGFAAAVSAGEARPGTQEIQPMPSPHFRSATPAVNTTVSANSISADSEWVEIAMDEGQRNVGDLTGPSLYDAIYRALNMACPKYKDGEYMKSCVGPQTVVFHVKVPVKFHIGWVEQWEEFKVQIAHSWWGLSAPMHDLLVGAVAGAAQAMSEDEKNCRVWSGASELGHHNKRHCNIGSRVSVRTVTRTGTLRLDVSFASSTGFGKFDCVAVKEATSVYLNSLYPEFKQWLETDQLGQRVSCRPTGPG